jgi:hypothetical protein
MKASTPITVTLNVRDALDRTALQALLTVFDDEEKPVEPPKVAEQPPPVIVDEVDATPPVTADDLREAGKEVSKAAINIEKLVGPVKVMSRSDKARMAAQKRWEKERANKKVKPKPEHRAFEGEKQEPLDQYEEVSGWPDGRDIIEAAIPHRRE